MRAAPAALLCAGFVVGFLAMNQYMSPRAADLAKPIPRFVPPGAAPRVDPAAARAAEEALEANPNDFDALRNLGNLRFDENNFAEAALLYERALRIRPDEVNVRSDRGLALLQSRRIDEAIAELNTVLSKNPTHPQSLFILGVALVEGKGDRQGALDSWRKLVAAHPNLPEVETVKRQIRDLEAQLGQQ